MKKIILIVFTLFVVSCRINHENETIRKPTFTQISNSKKGKIDFKSVAENESILKNDKNVSNETMKNKNMLINNFQVIHIKDEICNTLNEVESLDNSSIKYYKSIFYDEEKIIFAFKDESGCHKIYERVGEYFFSSATFVYRNKFYTFIEKDLEDTPSSFVEFDRNKKSLIIEECLNTATLAVDKKSDTLFLLDYRDKGTNFWSINLISNLGNKTQLDKVYQDIIIDNDTVFLFLENKVEETNGSIVTYEYKILKTPLDKLEQSLKSNENIETINEIITESSFMGFRKDLDLFIITLEENEIIFKNDFSSYVELKNLNYISSGILIGEMNDDVAIYSLASKKYEIIAKGEVMNYDRLISNDKLILGNGATLRFEKKSILK